MFQSILESDIISSYILLLYLSNKHILFFLNSFCFLFEFISLFRCNSTTMWTKFYPILTTYTILKVSFIQKGLMIFLFLRTDEANFFWANAGFKIFWKQLWQVFRILNKSHLYEIANSFFFFINIAIFNWGLSDWPRIWPEDPIKKVRVTG